MVTARLTVPPDDYNGLETAVHWLPIKNIIHNVGLQGND